MLYSLVVSHVMYNVCFLSPVRSNQDRGRRLEHYDDCARLSLTGTLDRKSQPEAMQVTG
jgi:hypothetical protein